MKIKKLSLVRTFGILLIKHRLLVFSVFLILVLSILNSLHAQYPDEFDNILGGYFITQGRLPYIAYFTHHGPFAYFYAACIAIFSGPSFVNFRIILAISNFLFVSLFCVYIFKRFSQKYFYLVLVIWSIITLSATYWWSHMLLADSLAAFLILGAFINLVFIYINNQKLTIVDLWINSIILSLTLLTSLTYAYLVIIFYISILYWLLKYKIGLKLLFKILGIFLLPYLLFLMYLLITNSFSDFYYQAIYYNKEYYVRLSDGSKLNNPLRHLIIIFTQFVDRYRALLISIKDLNFGYPLNSLLAFSNLTLIVYFIIIRRYKLSLFVFLVLIYLTTRADPFQSTETDYQSLPYNFFSIFNTVILVYMLNSYLKRSIEFPAKLVLSTQYLIIIIFCFFSGLFLFNKSLEKFYLKFMGTQPLIYDRPAIAGNLNKIISENEYYYIGPFEFEEQLYLKSKPATKYHITLPGMENSEKIKREFIADLENNRPKIIVFNLNERIYGQESGKFLLEYLSKNYFTLDSLNYPTETITINQNSFGDQQKYDLARHFFFDKNRKDEIMPFLFREGWITKK